MGRLLSNGRIFSLTLILIVSNLIITGVSLVGLYSKSVSSLKTSLINTVERQKLLITVLHEQGKKEEEIIPFIKKLFERRYGIEQTSNFSIARQKGDSIHFLLALSTKSGYNPNTANKHGASMPLALLGKSGFAIVSDVYGENNFAAYAYVPDLQWDLVAKVPVRDFFYPFYRAIFLTLIISILLISLCVFLFVKISKPVIKSLIDSEEHYRSLFENNHVCMLVINPISQKIVDANAASCRFYGYDKKTLVSMNISDINTLPPDVIKERVRKAQTSEQHDFIVKHKLSNGRLCDVEVSIGNIRIKGEHLLYVMIDDITERIKAEHQIKVKNDELKAQNKEYKKITEELILAKEHAAESDRLKTAFLQNMSHEIRTPMNAIMGFSKLLSDQYNNKAKLKFFSKIIVERSADLLEILNEIIDVAKIESGQLPIHLEACDLNALFSELSLIFKEYKKRAGKEHIGLKIQDHYDPLVSVIITDKVKLKQIFVNLIGNAFKFTEKGKIQVGCKPDEKNNLLFYVSDSGIGIPTDKKEKVFEHFIQLDNGTNRLYGGTGIGLSIVKGFIKLLGGEIWLESELHIGTTFYFTIPINITQTLQPETIAVRPYSDYNFGPKTILIVEDDIYNAEYLKEILKEQGFTIIHTLFGHEAIELSRLNPLDMVLMDISLPDMNGYEATRQIKIFKPNLEIIAQTAYSDPEDKQRAFEAGCNAYITKPIERDVLLSVIKNHLSNQKLVN